MRYADARAKIISGDLLAWSHRGVWGQCAGVYEIVNIENGKRYIGSSVNLEGRRRGHTLSLRKGDHRSVVLQRAFNKYGPEKFVFRPLVICSPKLLLTYEQICLDSMAPEYNCSPTAGSSLGVKHSIAARINMSAGQKRRGPRTIEERDSISRALKGKKKTPEHAARAGAGRRGIKFTEEQRRRLSIAHLGLSNGPHSEEHRRRISAALKGRPHSPERIANIKAGRWG